MNNLEQRLLFINKIRTFFAQNQFISVDSPPIVDNPGMEPHIHPFQVNDKYLHTSPEFRMKEVLAKTGLSSIYSLGYCFRKEPQSPIHRTQFLMLEWYRTHSSLLNLINDISNLCTYLTGSEVELKVSSMKEIFLEFLEIDILEYITVESIQKLLTEKFPSLLPNNKENLYWDDYFFLLFLNHIEPKLKKYPYLIITDFPAPLSALAEISELDKRVAKRFEFYVNGVEVANAFHELRDVAEQGYRFKKYQEQKQSEYDYTLPWPNRFLENLEHLPQSVGIALGVERLFGELTRQKEIFWD